MSAGEFGLDALAAFAALLARPEVTVGGDRRPLDGRHRGDPRGGRRPARRRVVATSGPADPYRLTRQTFRLAHLPIPDPIAYPLAWLTTRVYLRPRGHAVTDISAAAAIARYAGPVLLAHGDRTTRRPGPPHGPAGRRGPGGPRRRSRRAAVETLVVTGGQHSWLYEDPAYRRAVAGS